ncbi:MAG: SDR family oxidoreductase [Sulfuricella sp.]|nr:SDR family oxidoreductase [Sulfuricella sp.]
MKYFDLTGRIALITGGAGLLGVKHASALLAHGATVVITDVNRDAVQNAIAVLGQEYPTDRMVAHVMDVTDLSSIQSVHESLLKSHGGVSILVNNAAIDPKVKGGAGIMETSRLENFPLDQWNFQLDVGLTGAFLCTQVFGTWMASNGGGVILNIASDLSVFAPDQRLYRKEGLPEHLQPVKPVTYSVIKAGLIGLTRYTAGYWAGNGVRVNALSPGGVYNGQSDEFVSRLTNLIPMGRMAEADEYVAAVQFLCSDASKYMTGQNIVMDGGRSIL